MKKIVILILALVAFAAGLTFFQAPSNKNKASPTPIATQVPKIQVIAQDLEVPWALAFLPDGAILFTERDGRVRLVDKEGNVLEKPIATISVKQTGESGLHGIAPHPNFNNNKFVYLYYTYQANGDNTFNRVSRFKFSGQSLTQEEIIVDKIPGAVFHDGGRIKFGPDGSLFVTTGDALNPSLAQNKNSLAGKILRVKDDGMVEVYSYGHRNPQGIAWDNQGRLWSTEHGQSATDEINLIEAGKNYGWPAIRGDQKQEEMVSPILQSGSDTWAPAGLSYYQGSLYFAGLRGQALYQVKIDTLELKEHFKGQFGRIRDVVLGPDDMLYLTTSNRDGRGTPSPDDDKIIRINPKTLP